MSSEALTGNQISTEPLTGDQLTTQDASYIESPNGSIKDLVEMELPDEFDDEVSMSDEEVLESEPKDGNRLFKGLGE